MGYRLLFWRLHYSNIHSFFLFNLPVCSTAFLIVELLWLQERVQSSVNILSKYRDSALQWERVEIRGSLVAKVTWEFARLKTWSSKKPFLQKLPSSLWPFVDPPLSSATFILYITAFCRAVIYNRLVVYQWCPEEGKHNWIDFLFAHFFFSQSVLVGIWVWPSIKPGALFFI